MSNDIRKAIKQIVSEIKFKSGDRQSRLYVFLDDSGQCRIYFSINGKSPVSVWGRERETYIDVYSDDYLRGLRLSTILYKMGFEDRIEYRRDTWEYRRDTWGDAISIYKKIIEFIDTPNVNYISPEMIKQYTNVVSTN
jgi:hypothetical protein